MISKFTAPILSISLILTACEKKTVTETPEPPAEPAKKKEVAAKEEPDPFEDYNVEVMIEEALTWADENRTDFLETDYKPLSIWLNERFDVKYRSMTPAIMFDQVPLNDIRYKLKNMPESAPDFVFSSPDVSRRELLSVIAKQWDLEMSYELGADGTPSAIIVSGP